MADALHHIQRQVPTAVAFVAILVAGWLLAKAAYTLVRKLLDRVGFDRAAERGGITAALARSHYDAGTVVGKLAYYAVLLTALQTAFGIWGPNPVSALLTAVVAWLPRAFVAIVILVVAAGIARIVKDVIGSALGDLSYGRTLAGAASALIVGLGTIAALNQIGVAATVTTPILIAALATIGGVIVVGVGGGLVRPMQDRWAAWLDRAADEAPAIVERARAHEAGRRDAEARAALHVAGEHETMPLPDLADAEKTVVISRDAIPNR
jgi:hypothetical protein